MRTHELTHQHRARQLLIRKDTTVKVERIWPTLDYERLDSTFPALAVTLAALVKANRITSSGVAAQYVRAMRRAGGVPGVYRGAPIAGFDVDQFATALRVTSVVAVKKAAGEGVAAEVAMANALTQTSGAMGRLVLNGGRETVRATSIADPACQGWVRVGNGECAWCSQYLDGEIRTTEGYDFAAHDGCGCTAQPVYG